MSIIHAFDTSEEFISPGEKIKPVAGLASVTIVVFEKHNLGALLHRYAHEEIAKVNMGVDLPVYKIIYNGKQMNVFLSVQNGSAAAECMEILIAMGSRKFVYYGSCGVLADSVTSEKIILPVEAYRDEGMSYHYLPASDFLMISNASKTEALLFEMAVPYIKAKTWTTDAIFRETRNNVEKRKKDGCLVVEMECASIEAVGRFRGAEVCYFLYTEDSLGGPSWKPGTMGNMSRSSAEGYADIALELAYRM